MKLCIWAFKSAECGYSGSRSVCYKTIDDCINKYNAHNFTYHATHPINEPIKMEFDISSSDVERLRQFFDVEGGERNMPPIPADQLETDGKAVNLRRCRTRNGDSIAG